MLARASAGAWRKIVAIIVSTVTRSGPTPGPLVSVSLAASVNHPVMKVSYPSRPIVGQFKSAEIVYWLPHTNRKRCGRGRGGQERVVRGVSDLFKKKKNNNQK